ncbi:plasmid partitioning protein [Pseudomonas sp. MPFS]|nr:plasmid partitioning protein [Pseudomonas sp. MPFS]
MYRRPDCYRVSTWILLLAALLGNVAWAQSRCTDTPERVRCTHQTAWIDSSEIVKRRVTYQLPLGTPPPNGWPVVLIYQGSFFPLKDFNYHRLMPAGGYYEGKLVQTLLDHGYAVVAPMAPVGLFWETNLPGLGSNYERSSDYRFLGNVFAAIAAGQFGPLDPRRRYATGISSGGYNTSRMAVSFPGQFRALAIQSGSYATCSGLVCVVPDILPADHPATLFLHGSADLIVPLRTMDLYYARLQAQGIETNRFIERKGGHAWFSSSPRRIRAWFDAHP